MAGLPIRSGQVIGGSRVTPDFVTMLYEAGIYESQYSRPDSFSNADMKSQYSRPDL